MKRFLICLMTLALLLSASVAFASAADYEEDESVLMAAQFNALYITQGADLYSDLAEDYYEWWWEEEEYIDDVYGNPATVNMRGFAMSPNGDYAYLGTLNGGDGLRGVVVLDTVTGRCTDLYYHQNRNAEGATTGFSYAKGIDADNRGYVYVGFTYFPDNGIVHLAIAEQQSDGTLTTVSDIPIYQDGEPGAGTHLGVNGVDVVTIGEKTYCYVVVNYDYDALYCFDVTDPKNPVLNTEFGTDGVIVFSDPNCPVSVDGLTVSELQYLDVDEEGNIYLVMYPNNATNGVMCITPDGSACTAFYNQIGDGNIYSISIVGDFLLCGAKSGGEVFIVDKETGEQLGKFGPLEPIGDRITRILIRNEVLYLANAGADSNASNAIYAGALSESGLEYIRNVVKSLNGEFETEAPEDDTNAPTDETKTPDDTNTPTEDTKAPDAEDTKAPEGNESTADTVADTTADTSADTSPSTDKIGLESGCASLVFSGGAVVALLAAAFVVSKKK